MTHSATPFFGAKAVDQKRSMHQHTKVGWLDSPWRHPSLAEETGWIDALRHNISLGVCWQRPHPQPHGRRKGTVQVSEQKLDNGRA